MNPGRWSAWRWAGISFSALAVALVVAVFFAKPPGEGDLKAPPPLPVATGKAVPGAWANPSGGGTVGRSPVDHVPVDFEAKPFDASMSLSLRREPSETVIPVAPLGLNRSGPSADLWSTTTYGPSQFQYPTLAKRWRHLSWRLRRWVSDEPITLSKGIPLSALVGGYLRDPLFTGEPVRVYFAPGLESSDRLIQPVLWTNGLQASPMPLTFKQLLASNGISVARLGATRWKVFPTSQADRYGNADEPLVPDPNPGAPVRPVGKSQR